jgi:pyruvate dehydrogenase E1 component
MLPEAVAAAQMLREDFGIAAEVWSATSFGELAREARAVQRANRLQPLAMPRVAHVQACLGGTLPVLAATDYVRAVPQLVAEYVGAPYTTLGTDGFGRSGTRRDLRRFFEVDREHIVVAALHAVAPGQVSAALARYGLDAGAEAPWLR